MKHYLPLVAFIFALLCSMRATADDTYPLSLHYYDTYTEGKLYISNTNDSIYYLISTNPLTSSTTIQYWRHFERNKSQTLDIQNVNFIDASYHSGKLWLLCNENGQMYVTTFDTILSSTRYYLKTQNNIDFTQSYFVTASDCPNVYIFSDNNLYKIPDDDLNATNQSSQSNAMLAPLYQNVVVCKLLQSNDNYELSFIEEKGEIGIVWLLAKQGKSHYAATISLTNSVRLIPFNDYLLVANATTDNKQSNVLCSIIDLATLSVVSNEWLNVDAKMLVTMERTNSLYSLTSSNQIFSLNKKNIDTTSNSENIQSIHLPNNLYAPQLMQVQGNNIYVLFSNALAICDSNLNIQLFDYYNFGSDIDTNTSIITSDDYLLLTSSSKTTIFSIHSNSFWRLKRYVYATYHYIVPIVLVLLCLFFYRLYRNQKRLFDAILDLPSSGFVFMINKYGKLRKVNDTGKELLNMTDNIPLGKQFRYYCSNEQTKQFADIAETGLVRRVNFNQKVDIISDNAPQEWLCSVVPLRNIAGRFHGIIITGIDITKELERQMLTNWAQLAHDMQTNLSTIRLNAEQIVPNNDDDQQRRSKILHQVNILRHRIRDIVTVGRDDKLERTIVNSTEFCNEVRQEFDDNIFSKIKFEMKLEDFNFICDKPKMLRAVRNAVENAIKYMKPEGGFITISCYRDIHSISISVKDTGIGMDAQTKSKIFVPFFSTARKTGGGYGIGTMIMQRVAELHGGKLIIESELGIGTEIIFKLPDLSRVKQ